MANDNFEEGADQMGMRHYDALVSTQLQPLVTRWDYLNYTFIQNEILTLAKHLAFRDDFDAAKSLLETMSNNNDRSICYTEVAKDLLKNGKSESSFIFLDSAISKGEKTDLTSGSASGQLGILARRETSNAQSRGRVRDALKNLDNVLNDYASFGGVKRLEDSGGLGKVNFR